MKAPYWYAQLLLSESHQPNVVGGYHITFNTSSSSSVAENNHRHPDNGGDSQGNLFRTGAGAEGTAAGVGPFADWMAAVSDDGQTLVPSAANQFFGAWIEEFSEFTPLGECTFEDVSTAVIDLCFTGMNCMDVEYI